MNPPVALLLHSVALPHFQPHPCTPIELAGTLPAAGSHNPPFVSVSGEPDRSEQSVSIGATRTSSRKTY